MESKPQNSQSSTESSASAQSSQAASSAPSSTPRREALGTEPVSGLNGLDSLAQTRGRVEQMGQLNSQTGAAGKAMAELSKQQPAPQSAEWPAALQSTLQQGWTAVANRVRQATPTQLVIGAAVVGAAVWLGSRKRSKASGSGAQSAGNAVDQTFADRWSDYPAGSDGSRSDGSYGRRQSTPMGKSAGTTPSSAATDSRSTPSNASSKTTKGPASGPYGQSGETWQRPSEERWDD